MENDEISSFLKSIPPFQLIEASLLSSIVENCTTRHYPKDSIILSQNGSPGGDLGIIRSGGIRVTMKAPDGEDVIVDYRGEGETFGFLSLIGNDRQRTTVSAVEDTECIHIGKGLVLKLLESNPAFTGYFLQAHFTKYIHRSLSQMQNRSLLCGGTDKLLFTTPVAELATRDVVTASREISIRQSAEIMSSRGISALVLVDDGGNPAGIVTDRDLRKKVVAKGRDVSAPVGTIMSMALIKADAREFCLEALLKMIRYGVHHLLVVDGGKLKGILTNHDIMLVQGTSPLSLAREIESQHTVQGLAGLTGKRNRIIELLLKEEAKASTISRIISEINDRFVMKILEIAQRQTGTPPVSYCWIVFGSEGRKEQTFLTDQDNALIYEDPSSPEEAALAKEYFALFTARVKEHLTACGFPLCRADYMASNPRWCQPLGVWKTYFSKWISSPTPESILNSLIFFDFRPLHGASWLAGQLREFLFRSLAQQNIFFARMASEITMNRPPLGFFRSFLVEKTGEHKNALNIKLRGIGPIVDVARLLALENGIMETPTVDRIRGLKESHPVMAELGEELEREFEFIMLLRIQHQMARIREGGAPDNFINPDMLSSLEKRSLKDAFRTIMKAQDGVTELHRGGMVS